MKILKRWLKIFAGLCVLIAGLILMPIPGPGGTPVTLAGLAILASELPFAKRWREWFLAKRKHFYETRTRRERYALIGGILVLYTMTTTAAWWLWTSYRS